MTQAAREFAAGAPADARGLARRLSEVFTWAALPLLALSALNAFGAWTISDVFFWRQDAPVLLATLILLALAARFMPAAAERTGELVPARPGRLVGLAALACLLVAWAGSRLVYEGYALSMDEYMARFDAAIFASGRLFGEIPQAWRDFRGAMQPIFRLDTPSPAHWSSSYLPLNAAFQGAAALFGAQALVNPAWAALGVAATYGVARRLWPDRPQPAFVAAALLATSSQLLVAAMTPYAMSAHLGLNMAWLWCFLRGGKVGHAAAAPLAFAACGLHQLVFHPLFAAPFVLQLWLDRRWGPALFHSLAYAAIGLFWVSYWNIAYAVTGFGPPTDVMAAESFAERVWALLVTHQPLDAVFMAENLVRLVSWQNPLTAPLALLGVAGAVRARSHLRALVLGVALTGLLVAAVMPFQGHGWGYRYLHGLLGSLCLLAAFGWNRLVAGMAPSERRSAQAYFLASCAASVLILLPTRAWQAHAFIHPYARASAAIERADAEVVLLDDRGAWYAVDLVRNDPFLRNRPVVLYLRGLTPAQLREVCGRGRVVLFDRREARAAGIRLLALSPKDRARVARSRAALAALRCGAPISGRP